MHRRHILVLATAPALGPYASRVAHAATSPMEQARIDKLIRHVELQKGMVFIRNGTEYTCEQAARFLRGKMDSMGKEVSTAREFIERIATRSSKSGKLYHVRLADGTVLPAGHYLTDELKRIKSQPA